MRGDVTMYSTSPLIGCDLARFGEGGGGARSLAERGKFTQSSSFVTHSAIFSGNAWGKKLITSNYLDGSSYQLWKMNPTKHWDLKAYAGCSCLFLIRIFCWVITMMMMLVSGGAIISCLFFASSPGCRWVLVGAVLIMGMVRKRCSWVGIRINDDVNRCWYSPSVKANFLK